VVLGIKQLAPKKRFTKALKALHPKIQSKVADTLDELLADQNLTPGRWLKKVEGYRDVWEIYVDYHYRMTFKVEDGKAILRNVGTHQVYDNP